jgi:excisionase family DNA binding protein
LAKAMTPDQILSSAARDDADRLLTVAECAQRLGVSRQFVRDEIRAGELKARCYSRPSGRTLYRIDLAAFVDYFRRVWKTP